MHSTEGPPAQKVESGERMMEKRDIDTFISTLTQRDQLSDVEISALSNMRWRVQEFSAESEIIRDRSRPKASCLLLDGIAARAMSLKTGQRQISALHVAGDFVDLHGLYLRIMDHAVIGLTEGRVAFADHAALRDMSETHPHLGRMMATMIAIDAAIQRNWILSLGRRRPESRLAHLFCELYQRLKVAGRVDGDAFQFPISQSTLADVLGLSIVHTNRTVQHLRASNLVTWRNGEITILDWESLAELGEFDPLYLNLSREPR